MRLTSEALRELYQRETARTTRRPDSDCLPGEMLTRVAAGEVSGSERELVADHLSTCSDCAKEYSSILLLKSWVEDASQDLAKSSQKTGSAPTRLVVLPRDQRRGEVEMHRPFWERLGSRPFSFYVPHAIAAVLLILGLALGAQLISLRRENQRLAAQVNERGLAREPGTIESPTESLVEARRRLEAANRRAEEEEAARRVAQEELARRSAAERASKRAGQNQIPTPQPRTEDQFSQPHVNVPIFDLDPRGSERSQQDGAATTVEVPADTDLFTLILNVSGDQVRSGYSLTILDHRGRTIWIGRGLRKGPYNNFTVALPRRSFPAGQYRLKLHGLRDGRRELVEEYTMRLKYR